MGRIEKRITFRGTERYHFVNALIGKGAVVDAFNTYQMGELFITVTELEKYHLGSLVFTEVELIFKGEEDVVCSFSEQMRKAFMTAGG